MKETADTTFFEALAARAGSRQRENQLSSTFAACFRESSTFQYAILRLLKREFDLTRLAPANEWTIDCEIAAPKKGHGRPDLCLRTADPIDDVEAIWIESKVDSVLTLRQIDKYLSGNIDRLVVITKREPDVRPSELDEIGRRHKKQVCALRWQDVHQALKESKPRRPVERWLTTSFNNYLEALGMASRQKVSLEDVRDLRRLFNAIRSPKTIQHVRGGFETAGQVLDLLRDVRNRLLDRYPGSRKMKRVGPALLTYVDDDSRSHLLQASFQKVRYQNWQFAFGISLPFDGKQPSEWYAFVQEREVTKGEDGGLVKQIATDELLDADKLERKLITLIDEWGVF